MNGTEVFDGNDTDYHSWLAHHPDGYVLNLRRNPSQSYAVLHRPGCHSISNQNGKPGEFTERTYIKVCADEVALLATYVGGLKAGTSVSVAPGAAPFSKRCALCNA